MPRSPLLDRDRWRPKVAQWGRYIATSVVANLTTITVLGVLVGIVNFDAGWSNVIATAVATIPSFELNRRWVWGKRSQRSIAKEVLPFWVWAFLELAISSLAVHFVGVHATSDHWSRSLRTFAVEVTTIGTTGLLWIVQFFLFDRILFRKDAGGARATGAGGARATDAGGAPATAGPWPAVADGHRPLVSMSRPEALEGPAA